MKSLKIVNLSDISDKKNQLQEKVTIIRDSVFLKSRKCGRKDKIFTKRREFPAEVPEIN